MKSFISPAQRVGKIGEDIAARFLLSQGFLIIERNFTRKWGEIDIVASKEGKTHFIEVKSVSCERSGIRPDENMTWSKRAKMRMVVETYLGSHPNRDWTIDLACVRIDFSKRVGRVEMIKDIVI